MTVYQKKRILIENYLESSALIDEVYEAPSIGVDG